MHTLEVNQYDFIEQDKTSAYYLYDVVYYAVPQALEDLGVNDLYAYDGNLFFEQNEKVLWMFPQGIVYVLSTENLPSYMVLHHITEHWYYYRIVS